MRVRYPIPLATLLLSPSFAFAQETIGPWSIRAAPVSATEIVNGGGSWSSLNVVNVDVDINSAFSGFSLIDDGYANGAPGTTVEVVFAPGVLVNQAGPDLVMFDGRYSFNDYAFSTEYDGFASTVTRLSSAFVDTGVDRDYYYFGLGPYAADVMAASIELTALGVPAGVSIERVRFISLSSEIDPLGMGVPCEGTCDFENYCSVNANSTGGPALMSASGSNSISANSLTITAAPVPNQFFIFFFGPNQTEVPFGNGYLCVTGGLTRILPPMMASGNTATRLLDLIALGITPGTQQFQCWFRDPAGGGAAFNTSDAISISFVP